MVEMQVFENSEFGQVRTIMQDGEPWFVAADVCRALEIKNPTDAIKRLDADERASFNLGHPFGETNILNEAGLYLLVMGSRKPEAKAFRRWIAHEVIPSIRKHGMYATHDTMKKILDDPDFIIATVQRLKAEKEQRKALECKIEQDKPYTDFARTIANTSDVVYVGDLAKLCCNSGINIGRTRLFRWLRENKYLMEGNKPYQRYIDQGLFEVKESCIHSISGDIIRFTTLVTGKRQMTILEALRGAFAPESIAPESIAQ